MRDLNEAREYVAGLRADGFRAGEIARGLREAGWGEEEVEALLEAPTRAPLGPAPRPPGARLGFRARFPEVEFVQPDIPFWVWWQPWQWVAVGVAAALLIAAVVSLGAPGLSQAFREVWR